MKDNLGQKKGEIVDIFRTLVYAIENYNIKGLKATIVFELINAVCGIQKKCRRQL